MTVTAIAGVYTNTGKTASTATLGEVIATISVGAGAYALAFGGYLSGAAAQPADYDNMALQCDPASAGVFVTVQTLLVQPTINLPIVLSHLPVYALSTIQIVTIAAGTTNVIYHAYIAASYPGPVGSLI